MPRKRNSLYNAKLFLAACAVLFMIILAWEYVPAWAMWIIAGLCVSIYALLRVCVDRNRSKEEEPPGQDTTDAGDPRRSSGIPYDRAIWLPLLRSLRDGRQYARQESVAIISEEFALTEAERNERRGPRTVIDYRVGWARTWLKNQGLAEYPRSGYTRITSLGLEALECDPQVLDERLVERVRSSRHSGQTLAQTELEQSAMEYAAADDVSSRFRFISERTSENPYRTEDLKHVTTRGQKVRSKGELVIANQLEQHGIPYAYEKALRVDGKVFYPDFTIESTNGDKYYWEHAGMLDDDSYRRHSKQKQLVYRRNGIHPAGEARGSNGVLIVTRDGPNEGMSSAKIDHIIKSVILR